MIRELPPLPEGAPLTVIRNPDNANIIGYAYKAATDAIFALRKKGKHRAADLLERRWSAKVEEERLHLEYDPEIAERQRQKKVVNQITDHLLETIADAVIRSRTSPVLLIANLDLDRRLEFQGIDVRDKDYNLIARNLMEELGVNPRNGVNVRDVSDEERTHLT